MIRFKHIDIFFIYLNLILILWPIKLTAFVSSIDVSILITIAYAFITRLKLVQDRIIYLLFLLTLSSAISLLLGFENIKKESASFVIKLLEGTILLWLIYSLGLRSIHSIVGVLKILVAVAFFSSTLTIIEYLFFIKYDIWGEIRVGGGALHGASYGGVLGSSAVLSAFLLVSNGQARYILPRPIALLLLLLTVTATLLCNTRIWLISSGIVIIIMLYKKYRWVFLVALSIVGYLLIDILSRVDKFVLPHEVSGETFSRFLLLFNFSLLQQNPRFMKWQEALSYFYDNPIFGVGPMSLDLSSTGAVSVGAYQSDSLYVDLLSTHGIIGISIFLIIIIRYLYQVLAIKNTPLLLRTFLIMHLFVWLIGGLAWNILVNFNGILFMCLFSVLLLARYILLRDSAASTPVLDNN